MTSPTFDIKVSLEPHLLETLEALHGALPKELNSTLNSEISSPEIRYETLAAISKWARSDVGRDALKAKDLEPSSYSMVALLAGTTTFPSSKLPPNPKVLSEEDIAKQKKDERKAIVYIINALLSVGGTGFATSWATGRLGWRDEWKVLFSLLVAFAVAVSEAILYIIWQSRKSSGPRRSKPNAAEANRKKHDGDVIPNDSDNIEEVDTGKLRRRILPRE